MTVWPDTLTNAPLTATHDGDGRTPRGKVAALLLQTARWRSGDAEAMQGLPAWFNSRPGLSPSLLRSSGAASPLPEGDRAEARRAKADAKAALVGKPAFVPRRLPVVARSAKTGFFDYSSPRLMRRLPFPARRIWSKHPSRAGLCLCASPRDARQARPFFVPGILVIPGRPPISGLPRDRQLGRTRNPDTSTVPTSGFRVRRFASARNDEREIASPECPNAPTSNRS